MKVSNQEKTSVVNLFNFVKEIYDIKRPFNGNIESNYIDWNAIDPELPGVSRWSPLSEDPNLLCVIERLSVPKPPEPDPELADWITMNADGRIVVKDQVEYSDVDEDGNEIRIVEKFDEDSRRVELQTAYSEEIAAWSAKADLIRRGNAIFDTFLMYRDEVLSSNLKKEMVLGNFIFDSSRHPVQGSIKYPILTSSVEVEVLADTKAKIAVRLNPEEKTVVHNEIFVAFDKDNLNGQEFDSVKTIINDRNCNLVDAEDFQQVFSVNAVRLSPKCRWRASLEEKRQEDEVYFQIYPMPVFFIQTKATGLKEAVGSIVEKIEKTNEIPEHLVEIASPDRTPSVASEEDEEPSFDLKLARTAGEDPEILLTKTANAEQLTIAADIERNNVLLVQGPPGTGKTHTIANLMGHFLAQGKRVLVTSEKVKALSVLKEKLPEAIRPLCVSQLGDKKDLMSTAQQLQNELTAKPVTLLKKSIARHEQKRRDLIESLATLRQQIYALRQKDGATITYNGRGYSFVELAKTIHAGEKEFASLIPGKVTKGAVCPNLDDIKEIYATNGCWSPDVERELAVDMPLAKDLPTPGECSEMFAAYARVRNDHSVNEAVVSESTKCDLDRNRIVEFKLNGEVVIEVPLETRSILADIDESSFGILRHRDPIGDGMLTIGADDPQLIDKVAGIATLLDEIDEAKNQLRFVDKVFDVKPTCDIASVEAAVNWFVANRPDGKVTSFERIRAKFIKPEVIENEETLIAALNGKDFPSSKAEFKTVLLATSIVKNKQQVLQIWKRFVADIVGIVLDETNPDAVDPLLEKRAEIREALDWWCQVFEPLYVKLNSARLTSAYLSDPGALQPDERIRMARVFIEVLTKVLRHEAFAKDGAQFEKWRGEALDRLSKFTGKSAILNGLRDALSSDGREYAEYFEELVSIEGERVRYRRRDELLKALNDVAPDWAHAIVGKRPGFDCKLMPPNLFKAWEWKQLELLYRELASVTIDELQKNVAKDAQRLRECTADLAADKAWLAVQLRLGRGELSALAQTAEFMRKATGKGKNVERFRQAAVAKLPECRGAVPAWIMTLDQAIANFGSAGQFDIIIVDEASQADITAIPVLYMSEKIIVVGDDKQVTPDTVGTQIDRVNSLADQYLKNYVKSPALYDMKMSLYGLIKANAFRSRMLVEHFRCVPDIIGFSNQLCYENKIRPLRDRNDTQLLPAIVPWRVDVKDEDVSEFNDVEANEAINLINAMIAQPEYKGKTFGLIAMRSSKGEVDRLRSLVNEKIDPKEKQARDIICGTSAQFQGDERDVIVMLLCNSAKPGEMLRLVKAEAREDEAMKRYNVAVSRAKDQLWVIHSFDPASQLRADDIRSNLFNWIKGTDAQRQHEGTVRCLADSEFEVEVAKALIGRGYKIEQQHEVGCFRIDIVVHGRNAAVALECDGERFHSSDEAVRHDMERQAILERNGWRFIRLRGGEYYRDPEAAMDRVCQELSAKGIEPNLGDVILQSSDLLERIKITLQTGAVAPSIENEEATDLPVVTKLSKPRATDRSEVEDLPETVTFELPKTEQADVLKSVLSAAEAAIPLFEEDDGIEETTVDDTQSEPETHEPEVTENEPTDDVQTEEETVEESIEDIDLPSTTPITTSDDGDGSALKNVFDLEEEVKALKETKPLTNFAQVDSVNISPLPERVKKTVVKPKAQAKTKATVSKRKSSKKPSVNGLESSPLPTEAYTKRIGLTDADRQRIIEEDAVIWSELEELGCVLIDNRPKGGPIWVAPPLVKKKEIEKTMFSLAKRYRLSFNWKDEGGKATKHTPAWYISLNDR